MSKTVLIVDDEDYVRDSISEVVQTEGYQPITARDGYEAIKKLKAGSVDLIITDISMPEMCGDELITMIANGYPDMARDYAGRYFMGCMEDYLAFVETHKSTPTLLMSTDENGPRTAELIDSEFLPKKANGQPPFDQVKLVEYLHRYLSN